jgi:hypothetical protein
MDLKIVGRRMGVSLAVVSASLIIAATALSGTAFAPPQGAAPVNIADADDPSVQAHVTADGELQVTGNVTLEGTSQVEVTNTPLPVDVQNFPATQDVNVVGGSLEGAQLETVGSAFTHVFSVEDGDSESITFDTIDATSFLYSDNDDEVIVEVFSPLLGAPTSGNANRIVNDIGGGIETYHQDFVHPLPINGFDVFCINESEDCTVYIMVFGF